MLYILIFFLIVKIISLLNIPIEQPYLTFIIMMETPLTLPQYNWNSRDSINLISWSLSSLASLGIINNSHVIIAIEILSWLWLIIDSILENLEQKTYSNIVFIQNFHIPICFSIFAYAKGKEYELRSIIQKLPTSDNASES